jgi:hypothetical protein
LARELLISKQTGARTLGQDFDLMLTPEEAKVLTYLGRHFSAPIARLTRDCLPTATPDWVERVVAQLDWLGYVAVFYGPDGQPGVLQITDRGRAQVGRVVASFG